MGKSYSSFGMIRKGWWWQVIWWYDDDDAMCNLHVYGDSDFEGDTFF